MRLHSIGKFVFGFKWSKDGVWKIDQKDTDDVFSLIISAMIVNRNGMKALQFTFFKFNFIVGTI